MVGCNNHCNLQPVFAVFPISAKIVTMVTGMRIQGVQITGNWGMVGCGRGFESHRHHDVYKQML